MEHILNEDEMMLVNGAIFHTGNSTESFFHTQEAVRSLLDSPTLIDRWEFHFSIACVYARVFNSKKAVDQEKLYGYLSELDGNALNAYEDLHQYCELESKKPEELAVALARWVFARVKGDGYLSPAEQEASRFIGSFIAKQVNW